jgi:hypothetical protein
LDAVKSLCLHEHCKNTCDNGKKCNTFYQRGSKDHVCTNVVHSLRLAGNTFYGAFTDLTDTDTAPIAARPAPIAPRRLPTLLCLTTRSLIPCLFFYID